MRQLLIRSLLVFVGLSVLLAAACGGDESSEADAQPQAQPQEQEQQGQGEQAAVEEQPTAARPQPEQQQAQRQEQPEQPDSSEPEDGEEPAEQEAVAEAQSAESKQSQAGQAEAASPVELTLGGARTARLLLPGGVDTLEPRPLIVLLHGYSSNSREADAYFQFSQLVQEHNFGLLLPDGTVDQIGNQFWNATDECCDIFGTEVDDAGHLQFLIAETQGIANFDQVFIVGHSNGGFMAYRLACEGMPGLRGIVSLAGGDWHDPDDCRVPAPLSVLQIHGDRDRVVLYAGGRLPDHPDPERLAVPGAKASLLRWVERAGCSVETAEELGLLDADTLVDGAETVAIRFNEGCAGGKVLELWTIRGGGHVPFVWETQFSEGILTWLDGVYRGEPATVAEPAVTTVSIGGERGAELLLPNQRESGPLPLILSLHGYQGEADAHDWYFGLSSRIPAYGFALITPQGTTDARGYRFWNATEACCNFNGSAVDDSAWLSGLVAEAKAIINESGAEVAGVYAVGYSNGGFMAYRLACDGLEGLVAIASLAGSSFGDEARCAEAPPVSVLQIHGTADRDIPYAGTLEYEDGYPGALALVRRWAERAGCKVEAEGEAGVELERIDLDAVIDGAETAVRRIRDGCRDGITIELWTIEDGDHGPYFQADWPDHLLRWLLSESRAN